MLNRHRLIENKEFDQSDNGLHVLLINDAFRRALLKASFIYSIDGYLENVRGRKDVLWFENNVSFSQTIKENKRKSKQLDSHINSIKLKAYRN